eukprot:gene29268-36289_t
MKKKSDRLSSIREIVSTFKTKAQSIYGHKSNALRSKIAIVWYLTSESQLSSYLVDEREFTTLLSAKLTEIVAVQ